MPMINSGNRWRTVGISAAAIVILSLVGFAFLRWQESRSYAVTGDPSILADLPAMSLGSPDAPVTIAEFADYQCPACRLHEQTEMVAIKERLIDTGKARLLRFDFPLKMHPNAPLAARAARCAGEQDRFWEYHDALYSAQPEWSGLEDPRDAFEALAARTLGDEAAFSECLSSRRYKREVDQDVKLGRSMGVRATPTLFVDGKMLDDAGSADAIESLVLQAIAARQPAP